MHKEAHQAAGGPTSLGATSKEGAHPQLSSGTNLSVLVDQTKLADGLKTAHTDSDEPIIVSDESEEEEEVIKDKDTHASSHDVPEDTSIPHPPSPKSAQIQELMAQAQLLQSQKDKLEQQKAKSEAKVASLKARPSYPDINQLTNLLVTSLKPEFLKLLASHDFASCLPNALKEISSKFTDSSREIKELKKHVQDMEIELPGDLKEIPTKLETFTSTIFSLSSQAKLKTLDSLPSLLNKVTETLNMFATMVENASGATTNDVPSAGQATASPAEEEKNTNPMDVEPNLHNELGPILLKVHREDGTSEVISNVKVSDLHLAEWREVVQACPDRKEKGWKTIYELIKERMEYLDQTEKELKIDFNKPLKE
ncbi:hypothetical protein Tco_0685038 [Tanacetum coccineum]